MIGLLSSGRHTTPLDRIHLPDKVGTMIDYPIITEKTDNDLYKVLMGAVVHEYFPKAIATYEFFNRGKTIFPEGFGEALRKQVNFMAKASTSRTEMVWLAAKPFVKSNYATWFADYQFDPNEVTVIQTGGDIYIRIYGLWERTIYWEVPLMAIISELYFVMTGHVLASDWLERIHRKADNLSINECLWSDFGTRRRRSLKVQEAVVRNMKQYKGFMGTSNIHQAFLNDVSPIGTMAHECLMAMSALYGVKMANKGWRNLWKNYYGDMLTIFLTDTFTTDVFLADFNKEEAEFWSGLRQDSGNPYDWTDNKVIPFYKRIGVSLKRKKLIYSNNLTDEEFVDISLKYRKVAIPLAGIGTYLTNDTFTPEQVKLGFRALNMVIKMTAINFGGETVPVVKLSDDVGKHTGNKNQIAYIMRELGIGQPSYQEREFGIAG
jgi:nicotinate phosphoribosyltransferase